MLSTAYYYYIKSWGEAVWWTHFEEKKRDLGAESKSPESFSLIPSILTKHKPPNKSLAALRKYKVTLETPSLFCLENPPFRPAADCPWGSDLHQHGKMLVREPT